MSAFKPYGEISAITIGDVPRLIDSKGNDVSLTMEGCERLAACWNACRKLYNPANHIEATDEYVKRLETLRRDAWARAQEAEAKLASIATPTPAHEDAA
jgi:hypothetical protein